MEKMDVINEDVTDDGQGAIRFLDSMKLLQFCISAYHTLFVRYFILRGV